VIVALDRLAWVKTCTQRQRGAGRVGDPQGLL